ncbi:DEDD exonuclease domain-containing protein [Trueperella pecoris]|uniref:DEDD exonuclease domain-containing protein n=1 Tax=Trueperella pecoris TaxID=2733571 RepID=UPI001ABEBAFA|nr:DEDD exonuclease domain-containing protein [Trueperella pecoris]QTG76270.1 DEDD exonuclease domain-containing protein [Trueperella pecoris]
MTVKGHRPGLSLDLTPSRPHQRGVAQADSVQLALDELGPSLFDVTFLVVDLETTGGGPGLNSITEIGAVKVRGGETLGEFSTLVNPQVPIPAFISVLTGITNSMVALAAPIATVMPEFLDFVGDDPHLVLVAHNAQFDISHLKAACRELGLAFPSNRVIDTVKLARKAFTRDETPNYKLASLAKVCGAQVQPSHRALDDARATVDVLHAILSRLGGIGVTHLEDLLTATDAVPQHRRAKARLADNLPHGPGVYRFIGPGGEVLYVGTSINVYKRVRQYFTAAEKRRRMAEMVDLSVEVHATPTATQLEANVLEVRLIEELDPPYNRRSRRTHQRPWLALTNEPFPRLIIKRKILREEMTNALGPFTSNAQANRASELLASATGLRECKQRLPLVPDGRGGCHLHDLGKCSAPCRTGVAQAAQVGVVEKCVDGRVASIVEKSMSKLRMLSQEERFEQAVSERDRLYALVSGAKNYEEFLSLVGNERIIAARGNRGAWDVVVIDYGLLRTSATTRNGESPEDLARWLDQMVPRMDEPTFASQHVSHDEVRLLSQWLLRPDVRLLKATAPHYLSRAVDGAYGCALPSLPSQSRSAAATD